MKYDISICMPAIRTHLWERLYESTKEATGPYSWEMIMVGPNEPPGSLKSKENFKFFKDFGHPARCAQIATMLAEGELMMWASDDGYFMPNSIRECINLHREKKEEDVIVIRHAEGRNFSGDGMPDDYWVAKHPDGSWSNYWPDHQRVSKIKDDRMIAPVGLYNLEYFRELYSSKISTDELIDRVGLGKKMNSMYKTLSGGTKQRVGIAISLINEPELLFLDEPTAGLDPQARRETWNLIRELKEQGKTIFLPMITMFAL